MVTETNPTDEDETEDSDTVDSPDSGVSASDIRIMPRPNLVDARVAYSLSVVDLSNPAAIVVNDPINVPGVFRGVASYGHGYNSFEVIFTSDRALLESEADAAQAFDALVISANAATLVDLHELSDGAQDVFVEGHRATYVTSSPRSWGPWFLERAADSTSEDSEEAPAVTLTALDLSYAGWILTGNTAEVADAGYGSQSALENAYGIVSSGNNLYVYDVINPYAITLTLSGVTPGWYGASNIVLPGDGHAYLPAGLFGLQVLDL